MIAQRLSGQILQISQVRIREDAATAIKRAATEGRGRIQPGGGCACIRGGGASIRGGRVGAQGASIRGRGHRGVAFGKRAYGTYLDPSNPTSSGWCVATSDYDIS
jgi:hypothetical protein